MKADPAGKEGKTPMLRMNKPKDTRKHQEKSIEEICSETWEMLYRYVYFKVQNREEAEDITQEAYVKALSRWQQKAIRPDNHVAYLKTTALNVIRDRWRKTKRKGAEVNLEMVNPLEMAAESYVESSNMRMMVKDALSKLAEDQRRVIDLRIIKGFSVARTAEMMGKKEATVRVIQYRALKALADILDENSKSKGGIQ
jgi:RNA polymerase sigma-70 factor (ECF subfamily)